MIIFYFFANQKVVDKSKIYIVESGGSVIIYNQPITNEACRISNADLRFENDRFDLTDMVLGLTPISHQGDNLSKPNCRTDNYGLQFNCLFI